MFQAFVDRGKAGAPTPVASMPARSSSYGSSRGSGSSAKVIGIVVALVVVVAVVAFFALHK